MHVAKSLRRRHYDLLLSVEYSRKNTYHLINARAFENDTLTDYLALTTNQQIVRKPTFSKIPSQTQHRV